MFQPACVSLTHDRREIVAARVRLLSVIMKAMKGEGSRIRYRGVTNIDGFLGAIGYVASETEEFDPAGYPFDSGQVCFCSCFASDGV